MCGKVVTSSGFDDIGVLGTACVCFVYSAPKRGTNSYFFKDCLKLPCFSRRPSWFLKARQPYTGQAVHVGAGAILPSKVKSMLRLGPKFRPHPEPGKVEIPLEVIAHQGVHCGVNAFSIDVNDLYYSLPLPPLCEVVTECIDMYGTIRFQNACGINAGGFMELLAFCLRSTFVDFSGKCFIQKQGVGIDCCLAPQLSDLLLAYLDRRFQGALEDGPMVKTFRYVDNFLVIYRGRNDGVTEVENLLGAFASVLRKFFLTSELAAS
ncbi:hypothetical protein HPB48_010720 [Haemaphysalis longicornis]|uniref:Reverse transcriptase domain-containing protein n=1 Tax=Haemaphysalis longicornis TaxID=44386 RepID=A0A9J6G7D6_HAELO|nr:hypothetical protein HPB48_010720 [Haemaphysalis longicornis]